VRAMREGYGQQHSLDTRWEQQARCRGADTISVLCCQQLVCPIAPAACCAAARPCPCVFTLRVMHTLSRCLPCVLQALAHHAARDPSASTAWLIF